MGYACEVINMKMTQFTVNGQMFKAGETSREGGSKTRTSRKERGDRLGTVSNGVCAESGSGGECGLVGAGTRVLTPKSGTLGRRAS